MRLALSALTVLSALVLPAVAHADTSDDFTVTGHGLDLTFTLPHSPTPTGFDKHIDFYLGDVTFVEDGVTMTADDVYFYTKPAEGGFDLDDSFGDPIDGLSFFGPKLFTDGVKMPTFKEGSFKLTNGPACSVFEEADATSDASTCHYNLTIDPSTTVSPEPNSIALLGTGALGVVGILRRRFLA